MPYALLVSSSGLLCLRFSFSCEFNFDICCNRKMVSFRLSVRCFAFHDVWTLFCISSFVLSVFILYQMCCLLFESVFEADHSFPSQNVNRRIVWLSANILSSLFLCVKFIVIKFGNFSVSFVVYIYWIAYVRFYSTLIML